MRAFIIFLLLWSLPAHAVESILELMRINHIAGVAIVQIAEGAVVSHEEYGFKKAGSEDKITPVTVFEVASFSKPLFAYAVLQLVERGLMDLDTPLSHYLTYPDVKGDSRLQAITARMVLTHSTGFPNWRPLNGSLKIFFQPGSRFSYSGEGFLYLQRAVETLTGESLETHMQKNVFGPLGMTQSSYIWQPAYTTTQAYGHDAEGIAIERTTPFFPNAAFTLHTTALDYAKFVVAILQDVGLKASTIQEMLTPQIHVEDKCVDCTLKPLGKRSDSIAWGLGWGLQRSAVGRSFWHWGDNYGYKCYMEGFKDKKSGTVILTNGVNGLNFISEWIFQKEGSYQPAFAWLQADY